MSNLRRYAYVLGEWLLGCILANQLCTLVLHRLVLGLLGCGAARSPALDFDRPDFARVLVLDQYIDHTAGQWGFCRHLRAHDLVAFLLQLGLNLTLALCTPTPVAFQLCPLGFACRCLACRIRPTARHALAAFTGAAPGTTAT